MARNHYELLELKRDATQAQIRRAYLTSVSTAHPDRGGNPELFDQIKQAYEVLSNENEKAVYDERLPAAGPEALHTVPEQPSQFGVVKGVHIKVHGQEGETDGERAARRERQVAAAQAEQAPVDAAQWRRAASQAALAALREADQAFHKGDFSGALEGYTSVVRAIAAQVDVGDGAAGAEAGPGELHEAAATVFCRRSQCFGEQGRWKRALADAEEAVRRGGGAAAGLARGRALLALRLPQDALLALGTALQAAREAGDDATQATAQMLLDQANAAQRAEG